MLRVLVAGVLLARVAHLHRQVNRHTAFRRELEETAQAFQMPGWDYDRGEWHEPFRSLV
jgi:hypothetical protein